MPATQRAPQTRKSTIPEAILIHQAGHAVIACLLGIPFSAVTPKGIQRYDEWSIWAIPDSGPFFQAQRARDYVAREMCMALAGPCAEAAFGYRRRLTGTANDFDYAMEITWRLESSDSGRYAWFDQVWEICQGIFQNLQVRAVVQEVANQLHHWGELTGNQVRQIVRKRLPVAKQADERYSFDEFRWCRAEDARSLASNHALCPKNTLKNQTCEQVLASISQPPPQPTLVKKAAA